jgi:hypothetical protein
MNLGTFHALVSTSLKRGTTLDPLIPAKVSLAVQWLERNYTFKYMERFRLLQIVANQRAIPLPPNVILKSVKFLRIINSDGTLTYLNKIEPEDMVGIPSQNNSLFGSSEPVKPIGYYIVGINTLVLNVVPGADFTAEGITHEYTDWPTDLDSGHPILDLASDLLLAQTLIYMAVFDLKDPRMFAEYKTTRDEAVNTLTRAEDETRFGGESVSMAFSPSS